VQLRYISQDLLVAEAGGDPWAIDKSLQHGRPAQISDLAQAFHNAGRCTKEADNAFVEACHRFEASWNRKNSEHPINDSAEVQRATRSLGVQAAQLPKIAVDLENIAATLAQAQRTSTTLLSTLDSQLQQIDTELGQAIELEKDPHLSAHDRQILDQHITQLEDQAIHDTKTTLGQAQSIRTGYSDYLQKSLTTLRTDDGYDPESIQALDAPESPAEPDRQQNQLDAFTQIFGRAPTSAADWDTAAALDPHSYDPKYDGIGPEIRVVKIRPLPGQGVVRISQWIEQRDVTNFPPYKRDFGNNRAADPHFNPENTKVTTYIDYENGIVVMRQNPSVELNDNGEPGRVKVGVPQGSVTQTSDGAVRIKYNAGNPLAPWFGTNPPWPLENHRETVNGDLVFTPQAGGVRVDGTHTNYPSMEVYQDLPNGTTHTVLIDPARSGSSLGPAENLWRHHDVGIGGRAFEPFDRGGWNPRYDVQVPLPPTDFGPVIGPPSVPLLPTGTTTPA
jgi:hydrolase family protein